MRKWVTAAALCVLFGCTVCGSDTTPINAAPATLSATSSDSPCGSEAMLSSRVKCVPNAWHCGPRFYDAGAVDGCDCDCGAPDPDCALREAKRWCYNLGRPKQVASCDACSDPQRPEALD